MALQYQRNHTIPRCMLKYWVDETDRHQRVHVYDVNQRRAYLSDSRGKRAFSFAIENDLHIVDGVQGQRATSVERWLGSIEGTLSRFMTIAHHRSSIKLREDEEFKVVMALQSLECRSRYNLELVQHFIAQRSQSGHIDSKKLALENFIDYVITATRAILPVEFILLHARNDSWLLCDRPFYNSPEIGYRFAVLTNKVLVAYRKSSIGFVYQHLDAPSVAEMNRMIALQARKWIVADSAEGIRAYASVFDEHSYTEGLQRDEVKEIHLAVPTHGWQITK